MKIFSRPTSTTFSLSTIAMLVAVVAALSACDTGGEAAMAKGYIRLTVLDQDAQPLRRIEHIVKLAAYSRHCSTIEAEYPFPHPDPEDFRYTISPGVEEDVFNDLQVQIADFLEVQIHCVMFAIGPSTSPEHSTFEADTVFAEPVDLPLYYPQFREPEEVEVSIQL